jgi:hypothetical protein
MRQHIREACFELIRKFHQRLSLVNLVSFVVNAFS